MQNKSLERWTSLQLLQPAGVAITPGNLYLFGRNQGGRNNVIAGVAATGQPASGSSPQDTNSSFFTLDIEGAFNLSVSGFTSKSPSAGAAINRGDEVFADGGVYDATSGVTTGSSLDADTSGTFIGIALDPVAAGATTTIRVLLKNSPCA